MRVEPCPACGKPIDVDDECRHLPDPPDGPGDGDYGDVPPWITPIQ